MKVVIDAINQFLFHFVNFSENGIVLHKLFSHHFPSELQECGSGDAGFIGNVGLRE